MAEYLLTSKQMKRADGYTIRDLGVPALTLMERAGRALADEAKRLVLAALKKGKIVCVCGGGNNGGDGFVCARFLREEGYDVSVLCAAERFSTETETVRKAYLQSGGEAVVDWSAFETGVGLVIDCLYGTGFHGELSDADKKMTAWIAETKKAGAKVLAADIPSGVSGETGAASFGAVQADVTLCIGEYKFGAFFSDGLDHVGEVKKADIGIVLPEEDEKDYAKLLENRDILPFLKKRKRNTHKGTYGRAAIVAGGARYSGAAVLSVQAALRGGAGYVALYAPEKILPHLYGKMPEALLCPVCEGVEFCFSEERFEELLRYDCIAFGMGIPPSEEVKKAVEFLLSRYTGKLILDAGALDGLAPFGNWAKKAFSKKKCGVLLTPHPKEFERISGIKAADLSESPIELAKGFAKECKVGLLLKGAASILTDGESVFVNVAGTAAQAKGGSGDVLSGFIASLSASGLTLFDGAKAGTFLCGKAAEKATEEWGEISLLPSDVISVLPRTILALQNDR